MNKQSNNELIGFLSIPKEAVELVGYLSIPEGIGNRYDGSYEIVPSVDFQLLPTLECYLENDILIHPIPYSEVSNLKGGYTVIIGE